MPTQTVMIRADANVSRTLSQQITLPFNATKYKVRSVSYNGAADTRVYSLFTDLGNCYIASFTISTTTQCPQTEISLASAFSNQTFNFYIYEALGTVSTNANGVLQVLLEFSD